MVEWLLLWLSGLVVTFWLSIWAGDRLVLVEWLLFFLAGGWIDGCHFGCLLFLVTSSLFGWLVISFFFRQMVELLSGCLFSRPDEWMKE